MFGISSSWKSAQIKDGNQLFDELEKTGFPGLELDYRITAAGLKQIQQRLNNSPLKVLSLHNYCPYPEMLPIEKASGDGFCLSAVDPDERKLAVKYSLRTIHQAQELGAKAVVFHCGRIGIERESDRWFELINNGSFDDEAGQLFFKRKRNERAKAQPLYFEALLTSLEAINKEAEKAYVLIGIENRYYWDQVPNYDEIGAILKHFNGGKIGYWHDVGHAQACETFGLDEHERFLTAYSDRLIGVHLHDAQTIGYNDHYAPGSGLIDFDLVRKYLSPNVIRIIEAHSKVPLDALQQSIQFLKAKGIID